MGAKNPFGGFFFTEFPIKKTRISCSGGNQFQAYKSVGLSLKK